MNTAPALFKRNLSHGESVNSRLNIQPDMID